MRLLSWLTLALLVSTVMAPGAVAAAAPQIRPPTGPGVVHGEDPDYATLVDIGDSLAFTVTGTNAATLTLSGAVSGGTLTAAEAGFATTFPAPTTGPLAQTLRFTGTADMAGDIEFTFDVDDGQGGTDTITYTITIKPRESIVHHMMVLMLQLAAIIFAARLLGTFFEKVIKQPSVLGELAAGMILGPYALGAIDIPGFGPLFPIHEGADFPISNELYGVATLASIVLLFLIGLETDFKKFFRFFLPGSLVGIGGVLGSFFFGDYLTVLFSQTEAGGKLLGGELTFMDPAALFMGTISTATSVGITARVLSEQKKLDSAEGTTILAGAVIDDVLGIIILAIVGGIAIAEGGGHGGSGVDWGGIGIIAAKAFGFWIIATGVGLALASRIARFLRYVPSVGSRVALGLGFALLMAGLAESYGLAMIIGAYIMGLALSKEDISHELERDLAPVYHVLVPVFFAVMGMLVDFSKMQALLVFGAIYTAVAIVGKILGGGLPVLAVGFNVRGACRVGIGMLPRGEVALIVAGVGLASGYIGEGLFGVAIMMTVVTTVMAPPILVGLFRNPASGLKKGEEPRHPGMEKLFTLPDLDFSTRQLAISGLTNAFENEGFTVSLLSRKPEIYQISREGAVVEMDADETSIHLHTQPQHYDEIKRIVDGGLEGSKKRMGAVKVKTIRFKTGKWEKEKE